MFARSSSLRLLSLLALTVAGGVASGAEGFHFQVNTTKDLPDATPLGDGQVDVDPDTPGAQISLRAAIQETNALPGLDAITLPVGKYKLTRQGALEDQGATGDLDVNDHLTITGAGAAETVIDGKKAKDRVFHAAGVVFSISGVTIQKGKPKEDFGRGGGIFAESGATLNVASCRIKRCSSREDGGGVALVQSDATITDTVFEKNKSADDGGALDLSISGTATVERVTFLANKAKNDGGAIEASDFQASMINCTFYKNKALTGGAVHLEEGGEYDVTNCTFAKNRAKWKFGAGGLSEDLTDGDAEVIRVANSVFDDVKKKNYSGDGVTSLGGNIDSGTTFGFDGVGDQEAVKPRLGKLTKTTGAPPTIALKSDSPAIDAANDAMAPPTDQRGLPRVDQPDVGTAMADVGAFEAQ